MPKLPIVKTRELIRVLLKLGFFKYHQVGSHAQFKHPDGSVEPQRPVSSSQQKAISGLGRQTQQELNDLFEALDGNDDVSDITSNLKLKNQSVK